MARSNFKLLCTCSKASTICLSRVSSSTVEVDQLIERWLSLILFHRAIIRPIMSRSHLYIVARNHAQSSGCSSKHNSSRFTLLLCMQPSSCELHSTTQTGQYSSTKSFIKTIRTCRRLCELYTQREATTRTMLYHVYYYDVRYSLTVIVKPASVVSIVRRRSPGSATASFLQPRHGSQSNIVRGWCRSNINQFFITQRRAGNQFSCVAVFNLELKSDIELDFLLRYPVASLFKDKPHRVIVLSY